jgi:hypothetical protein
MTEKLNQNIVFVFKIQVDGAVSHSGFFCDLRNGRLMKPLSRKNPNCSFKYLMIFIILFYPIST